MLNDPKKEGLMGREIKRFKSEKKAVQISAPFCPRSRIRSNQER